MGPWAPGAESRKQGCLEEPPQEARPSNTSSQHTVTHTSASGGQGRHLCRFTAAVTLRDTQVRSYTLTRSSNVRQGQQHKTDPCRKQRLYRPEGHPLPAGTVPTMDSRVGAIRGCAAPRAEPGQTPRRPTTTKPTASGTFLLCTCAQWTQRGSELSLRSRS